MLKERSIYAGTVIVALLALLASGFAYEPRSIMVYASRMNYQVDLLLRDNVDYVELTALLEPLGHIDSRMQGNKFEFSFNRTQAEFQQGSRQVNLGANSNFELSANFILVEDRGYVPLASVAQLLPRFVHEPVEFHAAAQRLFIGASQQHYAAELRRAPARLVLSFTAPVKPSVVIEKASVHLLFRREPIVRSGPATVSYNDPFLLSTSFAELPGGAEFIANVRQPATVTVAPDGRTVTIAAAPPAAAVAQPTTPPATAPAASTSALAPAPRVRPFVILDAAHGGSESGAALSPTLQEKTVTLALARRLQKELEARGVRVVLTRVSDTLLTADERAISANTSHAALYIALHASSSGHGVRLYTAMLPPGEPQQDPHSFRLWERAQAPYLERSNMAAQALAARCEADGLPARASVVPLRPLGSLTLPAVAVEVAPLGNSADELAAPDYQQKIAAALADGIAGLRGKLEAAP